MQMKTQEQIEDMLKEYENMLNYDENQDEISQIKLWNTIYILNNILEKR